MEVSYKAKFIEDNLVKLVSVLMENENIRKLVYHLVDDPLNQPNVPKNINLIDDTKHIVLNLFSEDILDENKVMLFVNFYDGNFEKYPLSTLVYTVDIIVPYNSWVLKGLGKIRPISIFNEISMDIDQKKVMGMTNTQVTKGKVYKVNKNYSGLTVAIKVNSSTLKGLA